MRTGYEVLESACAWEMRQHSSSLLRKCSNQHRSRSLACRVALLHTATTDYAEAKENQPNDYRGLGWNVGHVLLLTLLLLMSFQSCSGFCLSPTQSLHRR